MNDLVLALNQVLILGTNLFISLAIVITLFLISWEIASISLSTFSITYLILSRLTKERILKTGIYISESAKEQLKSMQEAFGSIRDLILDNDFSSYQKRYDKNDFKKNKIR